MNLYLPMWVLCHIICFPLYKMIKQAICIKTKWVDSDEVDLIMGYAMNVDSYCFQSCIYSRCNGSKIQSAYK